jgi:hypothetical protein
MGEDQDCNSQYFYDAEHNYSTHNPHIVLQVAPIWRNATEAVVDSTTVDCPRLGFERFECFIPGANFFGRVVDYIVAYPMI